MRLFLLPISTRQSLIYCQRLNQQLTTQTTRIDKITTKAATTWLNWEKKDSGWQKKVTTYGNKLFQRLPYEEWGLKSIPPLSARRRKEKIDGTEEVRLEYPEGLIEPRMVQDALQMYASKAKQAYHTKWLWGSIIGMPISAPVALIPVIPNLPFFYLCFRAWSHWRARGGSKHLQFLSEHDFVKIAPSAMLRLAYVESAMEKSLQDLEKETENLGSGSSSDVVTEGRKEKLLLSKASGEIIADYLEIPELAMEIERAVWQVENSLKAKWELSEERKQLDAANKKVSQ